MSTLADRQRRIFGAVTRWFSRRSSVPRKAAPPDRRWSEARAESCARKPGSPEFRILSAVVNALNSYKDHCQRIGQGFSSTTAFVTEGRSAIEAFAKLTANADTILPCGSSIINHYVSWLHRSKEGEIEIWIASDYQTTSGFVTWPGAFDWRSDNTRPHCLDHVSIIAHEIGHIALEHHGIDLLALPKGMNFPSMSRGEEWEAWLFSEFFRGFILADFSFASKRTSGIDKAADLFLHRRA